MAEHERPINKWQANVNRQDAWRKEQRAKVLKPIEELVIVYEARSAFWEAQRDNTADLAHYNYSDGKRHAYHVVAYELGKALEEVKAKL